MKEITLKDLFLLKDEDEFKQDLHLFELVDSYKAEPFNMLWCTIRPLGNTNNYEDMQVPLSAIENVTELILK